MVTVTLGLLLRFLKGSLQNFCRTFIMTTMTLVGFAVPRLTENTLELIICLLCKTNRANEMFQIVFLCHHYIIESTSHLKQQWGNQEHQ